MIKWQKIRAFADAVHHARSMDLGSVEYQGTVKLHGTNAGVRRTAEGTLEPQSRNQKVGAGHFGFHQFIMERETEVNALITMVLKANGLRLDSDVTLFGEWVGPGIQRGVGVSRLPEKQWVIFGARLEDHRQLYTSLPTPEAVGIYNIEQVPVRRITIDFNAGLQEVTEWLQEQTLQVEKQCPWAERFGVEGIGEGLVWSPVKWALRDISDLWFKTKGAQHRGKAASGVGGVKVSDKHIASDGVISFLDTHLHESRLQQGLEYLHEMGHPITMASTKTFLGWILGDLKAETVAEVEVSGLEWKAIGSFASRRAVTFFKKAVSGV